MCVCVCVCVCEEREKEREGKREKETKIEGVTQRDKISTELFIKTTYKRKYS